MNESQRQAELIAAYKELLRGYLEKRPSGLRKRISDAIGTNRSFVSQITNPKYSVPIPAHYVHPIIAVCHLSLAERSAFVAAYLQAHPGQADLLQAGSEESAILSIDLSGVADDAQRTLIKQALRSLAETMISLLPPGKDGEEGDGP
jgi:hypothetical protein